MVTQETDQTKELMAAHEDLRRAWRQLEDAFLKLQEVTERLQQSFAAAAPGLTHDVQSGQLLGQFLFLEELALEVGRVVDSIKPQIDIPLRYEPSR